MSNKDGGLWNVKPHYCITGEYLFMIWYEQNIFSKEQKDLIEAEFVNHGFGVKSLYSGWGLYEDKENKKVSAEVKELIQIRKEILQVVFSRICETVKTNLLATKPEFKSKIKFPSDSQSFLKVHFQNDALIYKNLQLLFDNLGYRSDILFNFFGEVEIVLDSKN
jgi:hypothetical protein